MPNLPIADLRDYLAFAVQHERSQAAADTE